MPRQVKLTVLGRRGDHLVDPVHDQVGGLLDQPRHDGERNGLLGTSRPERGRRVCAAIRVHRHWKVEAKVPGPARRTWAMRTAYTYERRTHGGFPNGIPKNLSTIPSEVPMKVPSSSWMEGRARFAVGTATVAPMTRGTKESDRKNISRRGVRGETGLYAARRRRSCCQCGMCIYTEVSPYRLLHVSSVKREQDD